MNSLLFLEYCFIVSTLSITCWQLRTCSICLIIKIFMSHLTHYWCTHTLVYFRNHLIWCCKAWFLYLLMKVTSFSSTCCFINPYSITPYFSPLGTCCRTLCLFLPRVNGLQIQFYVLSRYSFSECLRKPLHPHVHHRGFSNLPKRTWCSPKCTVFYQTSWM